MNGIMRQVGFAHLGQLTGLLKLEIRQTQHEMGIRWTPADPLQGQQCMALAGHSIRLVL